MNIPPIQVQPTQPIYQAMPVVNAAPSQIQIKQQNAAIEKADTSNMLTCICFGAALGFLVAAAVGPTMLIAPMASIAAGLAIGGMFGNVDRNSLAICFFLIIALVAGSLAFAGYMRMKEIWDRPAIKNDFMDYGK